MDNSLFNKIRDKISIALRETIEGAVDQNLMNHGLTAALSNAVESYERKTPTERTLSTLSGFLCAVYSEAGVSRDTAHQDAQAICLILDKEFGPRRSTVAAR